MKIPQFDIDDLINTPTTMVETKHPLAIIVGEDIPPDLANLVIFHTDQQITNLAFGEAPDNDQIKFLRDQFGYTEIDNLRNQGLIANRVVYTCDANLTRALGVARLNYFYTTCIETNNNSWVTAEGKIRGVFHFGKWPTYEKIYTDLVLIAEKFPKLNFVVTIAVPTDDSEAEFEFTFTYVVQHGVVKVTANHLKYHPSMDEVIGSSINDSPNNPPFPIQWIEQWGVVVREVLQDQNISTLKMEYN